MLTQFYIDPSSSPLSLSSPLDAISTYFCTDEADDPVAGDEFGLPLAEGGETGVPVAGFRSYDRETAGAGRLCPAGGVRVGELCSRCRR